MRTHTPRCTCSLWQAREFFLFERCPFGIVSSKKKKIFEIKVSTLKCLWLLQHSCRRFQLSALENGKIENEKCEMNNGKIAADSEPNAILGL